jgi:hypothetical protein
MHTAYLVITLITVSITAGIAAAAAGLSCSSSARC